MGGGAHAPTEQQPVSDNTSDLPSTRDLDVGREEAYLMRAPRVPHSDRQTERNRPGWKSREPIVCYSCFAKDHISPDCNTDPLDFSTIVSNYEALTPHEQSLVPNGAGTYQMAKRCLAACTNQPANPTRPKN